LIDVLLLHRSLPTEAVIAGITSALSVGAVSADVVAVEARLLRVVEVDGGLRVGLLRERVGVPAGDVEEVVQGVDRDEDAGQRHDQVRLAEGERQRLQALVPGALPRAPAAVDQHDEGEHDDGELHQDADDALDGPGRQSDHEVHGDVTALGEDERRGEQAEPHEHVAGDLLGPGGRAGEHLAGDDLPDDHDHEEREQDDAGPGQDLVEDAGHRFHF